MGHDHGHHINQKNLLTATVLNLAITIAEVIGGILSNSLALLSDALHNLSDTIAVFIAYIANKAGHKNANKRKTFGYKRIEILAALLNGAILVGISVYLFFEAYKRFINPQEIKGGLMLIVAVIGLLANLIAVLILKGDSKHNINVKAAYLHLLGDTMSSIAVIVGGVLIYFYNIYWIDPLVTVLVGIYIIKESWKIIRETVDILMQSTPSGLDIDSLKKQIEAIPEVNNIHHIHAWNLTDKESHFEGHVDVVKDLTISQTNVILQKIEKMLQREYDIDHVTLQFEYGCCDDTSTLVH